MSKSIQWAAELAHVQEVSLMGTADLIFWKDRLLKENLHAAETDGQAQLIIIAANAKFMGVRFRELSFSVLLARQETGDWRDAAYLLHAFNSCRLFAFAERVLFSTPYRHGDVRGSALLPAFMNVAKNGKVLFSAEMGDGASSLGRDVISSGEDRWEGPIFLPNSRSGDARHGQMFIARLCGSTRTYPFLPGTDTATIRPSPGFEFLQTLIDSHFVPKKWLVREDAIHAKSKTYQRTDWLPRD